MPASHCVQSPKELFVGDAGLLVEGRALYLEQLLIQTPVVAMRGSEGLADVRGVNLVEHLLVPETYVGLLSWLG